MIRKGICAIFAAVLLLSLGTRASAAEGSGTIRVRLDAGELPVTNGALTIYHVGVKSEDGYRITDTFGGGMVKEADATSPHLAQWLAETQDVYGKKLLLDVDGNAVFSNLGDGLYLVVQTEKMDGFHPIKPFLVALPSDGQWEVHMEPIVQPIIIGEMPQTGQDLVPFVGTVGMLFSGLGLVLCAFQGKRIWQWEGR